MHPPLLPRPRPAHLTLEGKYSRLEPLSFEHHADALLAAATAPGETERFRYLFDEQPNATTLHSWFEAMSASTDPLFHAVIDRATGRCEGRQALMRIVPQHGVIELGSIYWGPNIRRTRVATEAMYLALTYAFDTLAYRRFEWKCDAQNEPSRKAALRFGFSFEGIFRQHMVVKGLNRDTAWFAILDGEWPLLKAAYESWLAPENFDPSGQQLTQLSSARAAMADAPAK